MPEVNTSREDRLARQQLDDGDPEDTVYFVRGANFYHERDCYILEQSTNSIDDDTREAAQRAWKAPCEQCVLEIHRGGHDT